MENSEVFGPASTIQDGTGNAPAPPVAKNWPIAGLLACSGCAGDYEDPDATTWSEDVDEDERECEGEDERSTAPKKFPVQRH